MIKIFDLTNRNKSKQVKSNSISSYAYVLNGTSVLVISLIVEASITWIPILNPVWIPMQELNPVTSLPYGLSLCETC